MPFLEASVISNLQWKWPRIQLIQLNILEPLVKSVEFESKCDKCRSDVIVSGKLEARSGDRSGGNIIPHWPLVRHLGLKTQFRRLFGQTLQDLKGNRCCDVNPLAEMMALASCLYQVCNRSGSCSHLDALCKLQQQSLAQLLRTEARD